LEMMLEKGTIVRGNWSELEYRVKFSGGLYPLNWWVSCEGKDNPMQSGFFSNLGERRGNEIIVNRKPLEDRLIVIKEKKRAARKPKFCPPPEER